MRFGPPLEAMPHEGKYTNLRSFLSNNIELTAMFPTLLLMVADLDPIIRKKKKQHLKAAKGLERESTKLKNSTFFFFYVNCRLYSVLFLTYSIRDDQLSFKRTESSSDHTGTLGTLYNQLNFLQES